MLLPCTSLYNILHFRVPAEPLYYDTYIYLVCIYISTYINY